LATREEILMNSKIVLAALSLALVFNGASIAMAGGKKAPVDPRVSTISTAKKSPGGWQTWCDIDPKCNGWGQAIDMAASGKLKL
jgi:invasion protein IalB